VIATLDTNVLVSGTVFGGVPGSIINAAIDRRFTLALSPAILTEYENVLSRRSFGLLPEAVELLVRDMESHARIFYPTRKHQIVAADPDNDAVVDRAVEAGADVIVSGDSHLTELKQVEGITVVTSAMFIQVLQ